MMLLVDLPDVILKYLQSFLSSDDIPYFLNSSNLHFSALKRETIYFSLNRKKSREYVEDERFRERILSKVKDGCQQIGLKFDDNFILPDITDIVAHKVTLRGTTAQFPRNVSSLDLQVPSNMEEIPFLPRLQELYLYSERSLKDFSSLSHLKKLQLPHAYQLTDITPLQNISDLQFSHCMNIQNFSLIKSSKQRRVFLFSSTISDVSFLRNIHEVVLMDCNNITDISPLHGVYDLSISGCQGIKDISCLGNHHRFGIGQCNSIKKGFDCFRNIPIVRVNGLKIKNLNVFRYAKELEIKIYPSMTGQLSELKDIPDLKIESLGKSSPHHKAFNISNMTSRRLSIDLDLITIDYTGKFPSQLIDLKLENCNQIVKIINEGKTSIFHRLQSLHIRNCLIKHVNGLGDIPTVILDSCGRLSDISGLGRNRCVKLSYCRRITDVSSLATVPIVTIDNCHVDYKCLSTVSRLKIVNLVMPSFPSLE